MYVYRLDKHHHPEPPIAKGSVFKRLIRRNPILDSEILLLLYHITGGNRLVINTKELYFW